ncbi:family 78 glycoside hydrolase catalytic domain [Bifidobacterium simiarum]|nr:family 78 glycoside hydrolase catalytic domain [Bifidobacterium simiarum]
MNDHIERDGEIRRLVTQTVGKAPTNLLINDRIRPVDIEPDTVPVLRWVVPLESNLGLSLTTTAPNTVSAYRVIVSSTPDKASAGEGDVWDSGRVDSDGYDGVELTDVDTAASRRYWVAVQVWRGTGKTAVATAFSKPMTFGTGAGRQWDHAEPIWADPITAAPYTEVELPAVAHDEILQRKNTDQFAAKPDLLTSEHNSRGWALLRGRVRLADKPVRWATLNATGADVWRSRQFVYRAWVNGHFAGYGPTFPIAGETRYDGFDVTDWLVPGRDNWIGVVAYALEDQRFEAQLDVTYEDGTVDHFGTGPDWLAKVGNDVYPDAESIGTHVYELPAENIRTQLYQHGISEPDFDDADWAHAVVKSQFDDLAATPVNKPRIKVWHPVSKRVTDDGRLIVDFGRAVAGGVRLAIRTDKPLDMVVRYGEILNDDGTVKYQLSAYNTYQETWHFCKGKTGGLTFARSWGMRVFRYVELLPAEPAPDVIADLAEHDTRVDAEALVYPYHGADDAFESSDEVLDRVWKLSKDTIEALNGNIYADSWTRERIPYEADAWLQQRAHLALDDSPTLGEYSIDFLLANRTWPTEWPLYLVLAVHDAWRQTGSLRQAAAHWDQIVAMLPDKYLDEASGLIVKDPGQSSHTDGDLIDWPPAERDGFEFGRVNTVINALASQSYADAADLAGALGYTEEARHFADVASRMRAAIHEKLWDDETGAYVDGLDTGADGAQIAHCAEHASAFALAFAEVPKERLPRVAAFLRRRGMACSVYVAAVLLGGLYKAGFGADADALIAASTGERTWQHMIDQGAGGTMEAWSLRLKTNTTYSHPWASSPAYLLPEGLMGVRPLVAGFRSFVVAPQPGSVKRASVKLPVRAGEIDASYEVRGNTVPTGERPAVDGIEIRVTVPVGTKADVIVPPLRSGATSVLLDGAEVEAVELGAGYDAIEGTFTQHSYPKGSLLVHGLEPGEHVIEA